MLGHLMMQVQKPRWRQHWKLQGVLVPNRMLGRLKSPVPVQMLVERHPYCCRQQGRRPAA
jgi:hypothetical protein